MEFFAFVAKDLLPRLTRRFTLSLVKTAKSNLRFLKVVVPTTNLDELARTLHINSATIDLSGAADVFTVAFTVPSGKRWRIYHLMGETTVVSTALRAYDGSSKYTQLAGSDTNPKFYDNVFPLDQGGQIGMNSTNNGGDNAVGMSIIYDEEDAYYG